MKNGMKKTPSFQMYTGNIVSSGKSMPKSKKMKTAKKK